MEDVQSTGELRPQITGRVSKSSITVLQEDLSMHGIEYGHTRSFAHAFINMCMCVVMLIVAGPIYRQFPKKLKGVGIGRL